MTTTTAPNLHEAKARARKALRLADWLISQSATPLAAASNGELRDRAVAATGVNEPSAETWAIVLAIVEHREGEPVARACGLCGDTARRYGEWPRTYEGRTGPLHPRCLADLQRYGSD